MQIYDGSAGCSHAMPLYQSWKGRAKFASVDKADIIARLRRSEPELRRLGVEQLSLFGSIARGEAGPRSDIDLAATLIPDHALTALDFVGLQLRLEEVLGSRVDLVSEPARKAQLQAEIERDRVNVF